MNFQIEDGPMILIAIVIIAAAIILGCTYGAIQSDYQARQVEIEAIKAGLVQQPCRYGEVWVKPEDYQPYVIWEKAE